MFLLETTGFTNPGSDNSYMNQKKFTKKYMDNYPIGADTPDAPWNQVENPEREVEVTISITLSKTVKIKVKDYEIVDSGRDEDGEYFEDIDYSNCDLKSAVEEQVFLPQDAGDLMVKNNIKEGCDLQNYIVDDFEVILE